MDSNKCGAQIERFEVVETGRRRRWNDDEKVKIVFESLQTPRAVSSTARRYGISRSLLLTWRRSFGTRASGNEQPQPGFVPAMVMPDQPAVRSTVLATPASGRMEIAVGKACRVAASACPTTPPNEPFEASPWAGSRGCSVVPTAVETVPR
jgi:transposase